MFRTSLRSLSKSFSSPSKWTVRSLSSLGNLDGVLRTTRPLPAADSVMLSKQSTVPKLPLPSLNETLDRYLVYVRPLVDDSQFSQTQKWVEEFRHGEGKNLQQELEQLNKESVSYVAGFWDTMYLELREPLPIHTSPYLVLQPDEQRREPVQRMGNLIHEVGRFVAQVQAGSLSPDVEGGQALDMAQYLRLVGSVRLPQWGRDLCLSYLHSSHIAFTVNNHIYAITIFDQKGALLPEADIQAAVQAVVKDGLSRPRGANVGALTALPRESWAVHRGSLASSALKVLDEALFVVAYDHDLQPQSPTEVSKAFLHRDGHNRWWDKLQFVALPDSTMGAILEHTPIDGHTVRRLMQDYVSAAAKGRAVSASSQPAQWSRVEFNLTPALNTTVSQATDEFQDLISKLSSYATRFDSFGKNWIKNAKISPDAFVQMAFQLSYYKLHGHPDSTYESCMTKNFLGGRTETIRSVTAESLAFTQKWEGRGPASEKVAALRTAAQAHVVRAGEAKQGLGVDRHLFSLRQLAAWKQRRLGDIQYTRPSALTDPTMAKLSTSVLSTSNVSAPFFSLFGFGPVCPQGLGLAYNIDDDRMYFNVTSWEGQAERYGKTLESTLKEMQSTVTAAK